MNGVVRANSPVETCGHCGARFDQADRPRGNPFCSGYCQDAFEYRRAQVADPVEVEQ